MFKKIWLTFQLPRILHPTCTNKHMTIHNFVVLHSSNSIYTLYTDLNFKTGQASNKHLVPGSSADYSVGSCLCVYVLTTYVNPALQKISTIWILNAVHMHACYIHQLTKRALCWQHVHQCAPCHNRVQHWSQCHRTKQRSSTTPAPATAATLTQAPDISTEQMHYVEAPVCQRL